MNITIVGPGAIGSLWAYHLHTAGHNVSLWSRSSTPSTTLTLQLDEHSPITLQNNDVHSLHQSDLVIVTTKVWQAADALRPLIHTLSNDTVILFMHNGMGALDEVKQALKDFPLLLATTTHGALKDSALKHHQHHIQHTGQGVTQIGAGNPNGARCQFIADVLNHALPEVCWNPKIEQALWMKLAINCAINPLTAIENCTNGELNHPRYQATLATIAQEIAQVAEAEGIEIESERLLAQITQVIIATASNYSSMHQDIAYQRKTEIDYITGYLIKRAQQHALPVPENQSLYEQVKTLENSRSQS